MRSCSSPRAPIPSQSFATSTVRSFACVSPTLGSWCTWRTSALFAHSLPVHRWQGKTVSAPRPHVVIPRPAGCSVPFREISDVSSPWSAFPGVHGRWEILPGLLVPSLVVGLSKPRSQISGLETGLSRLPTANTRLSRHTRCPSFVSGVSPPQKLPPCGCWKDVPAHDGCAIGHRNQLLKQPNSEH